MKLSSYAFATALAALGPVACASGGAQEPAQSPVEATEVPAAAPAEVAPAAEAAPVAPTGDNAAATPDPAAPPAPPVAEAPPAPAAAPATPAPAPKPAAKKKHAGAQGGCGAGTCG